MQLGEDNLVGGLDPGATLYVQREKRVGARRVRIQIMLANRPVQLSFKQTIQGFFFGVTDGLSETLDGDATPLVISDLQILLHTNLFIGRVRQQVPDLLVVYLCVTDADRDGLVELVLGERVQLRDRTGHHASILEHS